MVQVNRVVATVLLLGCLGAGLARGQNQDKPVGELPTAPAQVTTVDNAGRTHTIAYTAAWIFDYWTKELSGGSSFEAQGLMHTLTYSDQNAQGKGWFLNFTFAPSITLHAEDIATNKTVYYESIYGDVDVKMQRYDLEAGAFLPWLQGLNISTTVGLKAVYIDKEFRFTDLMIPYGWSSPDFDSQTYYFGAFLGVGGNHPLGKDSPVSLFWTLQGIILVYNWQGKDVASGYTYEDVNGTGFGGGGNATLGLQLRLGQNFTIAVGGRGQALLATDYFGDSYVAAIAQLGFRF
jgi:hypothetical protein